MPTGAAEVVFFARAFERNPLEAFVAAGMLTDEEAGQALDDESYQLLAEVRGGASGPTGRNPRMAARRSRMAKRLIQEYGSESGAELHHIHPVSSGGVDLSNLLVLSSDDHNAAVRLLQDWGLSAMEARAVLEEEPPVDASGVEEIERWLAHRLQVVGAGAVGAGAVAAHDESHAIEAEQGDEHA